MRVSHKCKVLGAHRFGGLGNGSKYMREIHISACGENEEPRGHLNALLFKCREMLEDGFSQRDFSPMLNATSLTRNLCKSLYGYIPEELNTDEDAQIRKGLEDTLIKFKIGNSLSHKLALDFILITDVGIDKEDISSDFGIEILRGIHNYSRDADIIFLSPRHMHSAAFNLDVSQRDAEIEDIENVWRSFGFRNMEGTDFYVCSMNKTYFIERKND